MKRPSICCICGWTRFRLLISASNLAAAAAFSAAVIFAGSFDAAALELPATGVWNGFLDHVNVVECSSLSEEEDSFKLSLRSNVGTSLGEVNFALKPNETRHIILNEFDIREQFGTFRLEQTDGTGAILRCHTAIYRMASPDRRKAIEYAFSIPVTDPTTGTSAGLYNSFDPDGPGPVFNWLSIYNPGTASFTAQVKVYKQDGSLDVEHSFTVFGLAPGERRDFPLGHEQGMVVGLYEIIPQSDSAPYGAFLTRYSETPLGFNFAFALPSQSGTCDKVTLPVSTMDPATNWAEIANPGSESVQAEIEVRNTLGSVLHRETRVIGAHSQSHLFLNQFVGERNLGSLDVGCAAGQSASKKLLAQSVYYGHRTTATQEVEWAYATQAPLPTAFQRERTVNFVNTFFGAANWGKILDLSGLPTDLTTTQYHIDGVVSGTTPRTVLPGGSSDIPLHEAVGENVVGLAVHRTLTVSSDYSSELLRVFPHADGGIGTIMNVAAAIAPPAKIPQITLTQVASGLTAPVYLTHSGDGTGRLFIVEQGGTIKIYQNGTVLGTPFLDIIDRVRSGGERGLLSVAFHPDYENNRRLFVYYTRKPDGDTVVSEFTASASNPNFVDPTTERIVLAADQPFGNHNGGLIKFGPDGYLYIALGDGGAGGDPFANGQNLQTFLGKMLRIDVNGLQPYQVPADNPFVGNSNALPEIWAYGLRNPWRYSFDRLSGRLIVGDVGQNLIEEVDIIVGGGNYGWDTMEGSNCFEPPSDCNKTGLILPIHEYPRSDGKSVTGGYVYRGQAIPALNGVYVFTDFYPGPIWTLSEQHDGTWVRAELLRPEDMFKASFGEDENGELYIVDLSGSVFMLQALN